MSTLFGKKRKRVSERKRCDDKEEECLGVEERQATSLFKEERRDHDAAAAPTAAAAAPVTTAAPSTTNNNQTTTIIRSFDELGLAEPLVATCRKLGFRRPTPVQRQLIPYLLRHRREHVLAVAATGSGKTAAYVLPVLHHLACDPYGVYAVILTPTRELAQQIHQQVLALGSCYGVASQLVVGGLDAVRQSCALQHRHPHVLVATPGRLAALLRGPPPRPRLQHCRYVVLDEADRLLASSSNNNCGFERDVAELLLHTSSNNNNNNNNNGSNRRKTPCQTLLFSATMTASLSAMEKLAGGGDRLPLRKFIVRQDGEEEDDDDDQTKQDSKKQAKKKAKKDAKTTTNAVVCNADGRSDTPDEGDDVEDEDASDSDDESSGDDSDDDRIRVGPKIPNGLRQEYIFLPSKVRDAYLLATVRTLLAHGGRSPQDEHQARQQRQQQKKRQRHGHRQRGKNTTGITSETSTTGTARSAIIFVATCERAALVSGILEQVGVANVALHSLLSQPRRLAALAKFQSEHVRVLVATDVAARGLDIPHTDLVINAELPRNPVNYVHRVGRTARAGRRGRAVSLVAETDVKLVHAAEKASGRELVKCQEVTDEIAVTLLGPTTKAARLVKLKLADIGFDELVQKFKERKARDRKERQRLDRALRKQERQAQKRLTK